VATVIVLPDARIDENKILTDILRLRQNPKNGGVHDAEVIGH
jgi:hypothetical protein